MNTWLLTIFFVGGALWQSPKTDRIAWSDQRYLTWADFQGKAPRGTPYKAQAHCEMDGSMDAEMRSVRYEVQCYFLPRESWTKTRDNGYILHHEQLHFNLAEVHARRLRKALSEVPVTFRNASTTFHRLFREHNDNLRADQAQYDLETHHSMNRDKQAKWDTLIPQWLKEVEAYFEPVVVVPVR